MLGDDDKKKPDSKPKPAPKRRIVDDSDLDSHGSDAAPKKKKAPAKKSKPSNSARYICKLGKTYIFEEDFISLESRGWLTSNIVNGVIFHLHETLLTEEERNNVHILRLIYIFYMLFTIKPPPPHMKTKDFFVILLGKFALLGGAC